MYKYTVFLKSLIRQAGLDFIIYPVVEWRTSTKDKRIVEQAAMHRYIRDNWGSIVDVEIVRTSVENMRKAS